jgi:membrane associated rhomboid family serine protease
MNYSKGFGLLKKRLHPKSLKNDIMGLKSNIKMSDILLLLVLPIIVTLSAVVMTLFPEINDVLKLNVQHPSWWQFLTSSFVHQTFSHYFNNVTWFTTIVTLQLVTVSKIDEKKRYLQMLFFTMLSFPILSSLYEVVFYPSMQPNLLTSCGSSGIVAATLGFIPVLTALYFSRTRKVMMVNLNVTYMSVFYIILMIVLTYASSNALPILFLVGMLALLLYSYRRNLKEYAKGVLEENRNNIILSYLLMLLPGLFLITPSILFPAVLQQEGSGTDVLIHYYGLIYGLIVSFAFFNDGFISHYIQTLKSKFKQHKI